MASRRGARPRSTLVDSGSPRQATLACRGIFLCTHLSHDLLILGASTRAAAFSAIRCGFQPRCADYFADRDLAAVCPVDRIDPRARRSPVRRAGGIPRSLALVLYRRVRKPSRVGGADLAPAHALGHRRQDPPRGPRSRPGRRRPGPARHPLPGSALRSPGAAARRELAEEAAGLGRRTRHRAADGPERRRLGRRIISRNGSTAPASRPCSSASDRGARLIGVTRQLIGIEGSPFGYRGKHRAHARHRAAGLPASNRWAMPWRPPSALPAGSASTSSCATGFRGPSRSIPAIRHRSRFTSWPSGRSLLAEHRHACAASHTPPPTLGSS